MELSQIDLNIQKLNVFLKRVITTVFRITGQSHYMKFLTQTVPFNYNNLNLEQTYPQSLIQIYRWNPVLSWTKCQSLYDFAKAFMLIMTFLNYSKISSNCQTISRDADIHAYRRPKTQSSANHSLWWATPIMSMLCHYEKLLSKLSKESVLSQFPGASHTNSSPCHLIHATCSININSNLF